MKKLKLYTAFILILALLGGCKSASVGIIGGADGPTAIFVTDDSVPDLYKLKTSYIGNSSAVGSVISALINDGRYEWKGMELQTGSEPYGLTLNYELKEREYASVPSDPFDISAPLFFALIDNLGTLTVKVEGCYDGASKTYTREELDAAYEMRISEYAKTEEGFSELYALCFSPESADETASD